VAYCLFVDQFGSDTFQTRFDEMMEQDKKTTELYKEIEEIETNIAQSIIESQTRDPQIQNEVEEVDAKIQVAEEELHKLEAAACREKAKYDAEASKLRSMEDKLEEMELEKSGLQKQLVHSASDVLQEHGKEMTKVRFLLAVFLPS